MKSMILFPNMLFLHIVLMRLLPLPQMEGPSKALVARLYGLKKLH